VPPAVECTRENSVLWRLADPLATVRRRTSGHGAACKDLSRATDSATCSQAMVSWNPVGLALCVRRFAVLSLFLLDLLQRSAFLRVFEGPKPSRTASGHAGSLPTLTCVSALVFSHAPALALIHHLSKHPSHHPVSLSISSLSVFPSLSLSFSPPRALSLSL